MLPQVTNGGKTYTLRLRKGLKYGDGTAVRASDFEHAIKRVLYLGSGGSPFFQDLEGAEEYLDAGKAKADISGIKTDDTTGKIVINLTKPDGQFPFALTMVFAAPVPSDTPFKDQTKSPPPPASAPSASPASSAPARSR